MSITRKQSHDLEFTERARACVLAGPLTLDELGAKMTIEPGNTFSGNIDIAVDKQRIHQKNGKYYEGPRR